MLIPPFCPHSECDYHLSVPKDRTWYVCNGHYLSKVGGRIQRFRCKQCGHQFSSQTFSLDYGVKRHIPYRDLFSLLISSSGIRDMGRILKTSPNCITNRISRLARQSLVLHSTLLGELSLTEDLVADGFESFAVSQYFPNNIQLLAGKESQFWLVTDYAHLRRKGRMTPYQKRRNEKLQAQFIDGRVTIYKSFKRLMHILLILLDQSGRTGVRLFTDHHQSYQWVISDLTHDDKAHIEHVRCSSTLPRTVSNQLFSANYLDREIRKDLAEHTRETVQFGRNVVNQMERLAIYRAYHNYYKPFRIRDKKGQRCTHAEKAGIALASIQREKKTFFTQRRFLSRIRRDKYLDIEVWLRGISTPLKKSTEELPNYAKA